MHAMITGDTKKQKMIKYKKKAEATNRMYWKIKQCRGSNKTGLTRIQVPANPNEKPSNDCTEWLTIDTSLEMADKLIERNRGHFGQADGTFPTIPLFSEKID